MKSLIQLNTENMTRLWCHYAADGMALAEGLLLSSEHWPHKVWFEGRIKSDEHDLLIESVTKLLRQNSASVFIAWDPALHDLFSSHHTAEKLKVGYSNSLIGMSLALGDNIDDLLTPDNELNCHVVTEKEIEFWCDLCGAGFGYEIEQQAMESAIKHAGNTLYWFSHENKPVGTSLVSQSGCVMGFHQISVGPEWRGRGFAAEIVRHMIKKARQAGMRQAVLQASSMGLGVYKKLGFVENFELKCYRLVV